MAHKLSTSVLRERQRERERVATHRRQQRKEILQERAEERDAIAKAKAKARRALREERERLAEEKRHAKQEQIEEWGAQVRAYDQYLVNLTSLHHTSLNLDQARRTFDEHCLPRPYHPKAFQSFVFPARPYVARPYPGVAYGLSTFRAAAARKMLLAAVPLVLTVVVSFILASTPARFALLTAAGSAWVVACAWLSWSARQRFGRSNEQRLEAHANSELRRDAAFSAAEAEMLRKHVGLEEERRSKTQAAEVENEADVDAQESRRVEILQDADAGDPTAVALLCEAVLPVVLGIDAPEDLTTEDVSDYEIACSVAEDGKLVNLLIELPGLGVLPEKELSMTPAGDKIRFKLLAAKARAELWDTFAASLALRCAVEVTRACPFIDAVCIEAYIPSNDPVSGAPTERLLLHAFLPIPLLAKADLSKVDPAALLRACGGETQSIGKRAGPLKASIDRSRLQWAVDDDQPDVVLVKPTLPGLSRRNAHAALDEAAKRAARTALQAEVDAKFTVGSPEPLVDSAAAQRVLEHLPLALGGGSVVVGLLAPVIAPELSRMRQGPVVLASAAAGSASAVSTRPAVPDGMVLVNAAVFIMGSDIGHAWERPARSAKVAASFFIDRLEVTARSYSSCVREKKCTPAGIHGPAATPESVRGQSSLCSTAGENKQDFPINCIDRGQADSYCAFVGKRLPTEAQWELAARGEDGRDFPWGGPANCELAIVAGCSKGPAAVGSRPRGSSPFGALDMAGNVWEWVADDWTSPNDPIAPKAAPRGLQLGVLKGGSWDFSSPYSRTWSRLKFTAASGHVSTGVRCVKSL